MTPLISSGMMKRQYPTWTGKRLMTMNDETDKYPEPVILAVPRIVSHWTRKTEAWATVVTVYGQGLSRTSTSLTVFIDKPSHAGRR